MKEKLFTLFAVLFLSGASLAQNGNSLSLASMDLDEKSFVQEIGFPITHYQFNDHEINRQLQEGLALRKKGKSIATLAWIGMGVGLATQFIPKDTFSGGGKALAIGGYTVLGGGIILNIVGIGKKQKARKRVQNATYLYTSRQ